MTSAVSRCQFNRQIDPFLNFLQPGLIELTAGFSQRVRKQKQFDHRDDNLTHKQSIPRGAHLLSKGRGGHAVAKKQALICGSPQRRQV